MLSGARLPHTGDRYASGYQLIETNATKTGTRNGFTVEGITVVDSPSWTFSIYRTDNVRIENTNIICWILNGDGIDLCSVSDAVIRGCFIRTYDDCITLKVNHLSLDDTKNITIQDNLIWADFAGGIVVGPESGSTQTGCIHDVLVSNCTVLDYPTKTAITPMTTVEACASASILRAVPHPALFQTSASRTSSLTTSVRTAGLFQSGRNHRREAA